MVTLNSESKSKDHERGVIKKLHYSNGFYFRFSEAALAFENVDPKYKAVFAEPKPRNQSGSDNYGYNSRGGRDDNGGRDNRDSRGGGGGGNSGGGGSSHFAFNDFSHGNNMNSTGSNNRRMSNDQIGLSGASGGNSNQSDFTLYVVCSPLVNQDQLWRLFDIVPGLDFCQINRECESGRNGLYATVVYNNQQAANYAREKYHGLEYPPGERLIVKPGNDIKMGNNLNNSDTVFSFNNNGNSEQFCSVPLPPQTAMVDENTPVAQRCFIVCVSQVCFILLCSLIEVRE